MHEYLSYYSPVLGQMINLGADYGCPILENGLRDYALGYVANGSRIISFNNDKIVKKSFTVRWANRTIANRRATLMDMAMSDITAGVKGRLYESSGTYIECNIIESESSHMFLSDGHSDIKYSVITDDYTWKVDHYLNTDQSARYISKFGPAIIGIDIVVELKRTDGNSGSIGNITASWGDDDSGLVVTKYGLNSAENHKSIVIDTSNRTIIDDAGNNLFSKRYKADYGTFWTPKRYVPELYLTIPSGITASISMKEKIVAPNPSIIGGHVGLTSIDYIGPMEFDPDDNRTIWSAI